MLCVGKLAWTSGHCNAGWMNAHILADEIRLIEPNG
jgi:hypothetical protein